MACAPATDIPLLSCCQTGFCPFVTHLRINLHPGFYHFQNDGDKRRFYLDNTVSQSGGAGQPRIFTTISVGRYDYILRSSNPAFAFNPQDPGSSIDSYRVGRTAVGGNAENPGGNIGVLSNEITAAEIVADLERLMAIPFPAPGTTPLNSGIPYTTRVFPQRFRLGGTAQSEQDEVLLLGFTSDGTPGFFQNTSVGTIQTQPVIPIVPASNLALCDSWGRDYRALNRGGPENIFSFRIRSMLQGTYCWGTQQTTTPNNQTLPFDCHSGTTGPPSAPGGQSPWSLVEFDPTPVPPDYATITRAQLDPRCFCATQGIP